MIILQGRRTAAFQIEEVTLIIGPNTYFVGPETLSTGNVCTSRVRTKKAKYFFYNIGYL